MRNSLLKGYSYIKRDGNLFLKQRDIEKRIKTLLNNNPGVSKQTVINKIKEVLFETDHYYKELLLQIAITVTVHQLKEEYQELWNIPIRHLYRFIIFGTSDIAIEDKFYELTDDITNFDINSPLLKLSDEIAREINYYQDMLTILSYTYGEKEIQNIFDKASEKLISKKTVRRPKDEYMDYLESVIGDTIEEKCDPFNNPGLYEY